VLVHPSKYHYLERLSTEPYERYNIQFIPQQHRINVSAVPKELEVISLLNCPIAAALFPKMDYYKRELDPETFEKLLQQLLVELFINLQLVSDARKQEEASLSPILKGALEYINDNLYTISDVEEVASALYISTSYLFYLFRTSLHQTPKKYITDKRLLAAQRRIGRGMNPTAVYKECGFREYTTFFRSYCAFFGHPPSQDSPHPDTSSL
jgi:AraC-like DNA-binding protein